MKNSSALLSFKKERGGGGKSSSVPFPPFSPHFVCSGFVCGVLLGISNEKGKNCRARDRGGGHSSPLPAPSGTLLQGSQVPCWQGSGVKISMERRKKGSFWSLKLMDLCENPTLCGTRCLGASLVFIPAPWLRPSPSPPRAAAPGDKIKAIPTRGDLLLENNLVQFGRNIEQPGPDDGESTGEPGRGGTGLQRLLWGSVGIKAGI